MLPVQIQRTAEWRRIDCLARRKPEAVASPAFTAALSAKLRLPGSTVELFSVQAAALYEAVRQGGLYAPLPVGAGKTLITYLLPRVFRAAYPDTEIRPALVGPAKLVKGRGRKPSKTEAEFKALAADWGESNWTPSQWVSYEEISRSGDSNLLDALNLNLLILDEAHKCKAGSAAVTKKIKRFLKTHPGVVVCALTGTPLKRSLRDFAHIVGWCLKQNSPLPLTWTDLEIWSEALDEFRAGDQDMFRSRPNPGALLDWTTTNELAGLSPLAAGRAALGRRIRESYGVVCLPEGDDTCTASLEIAIHEYKQPKIIRDALHTLYETWTLPDGKELIEGCEIYRHARELALGFYYIWKDEPPAEWLEARRNWSAFVRSKLGRSRKYDSPDEIAKAYPDVPERLAWLAVRDSYKPVTIPIWLDTGHAQAAVDWLKGGGVVWTDSTAYGTCLHSLSGVPYFRDQGRDTAGQSIVDFGGLAAICSTASVGEGFNLQRFNRALLAASPPNNLALEQVLGRHHRRGQLADTVSVEVWHGCRQHVDDWGHCLLDAQLFKGLLSSRPKLSIATITES